MGPKLHHKCPQKKEREREFPGGLVVRIPGFHCGGPGSIPGQGTEILQATRHGQKKKRESVREREGDFTHTEEAM